MIEQPTTEERERFELLRDGLSDGARTVYQASFNRPVFSVAGAGDLMARFALLPQETRISIELWHEKAAAIFQAARAEYHLLAVTPGSEADAAGQVALYLRIVQLSRRDRLVVLRCGDQQSLVASREPPIGLTERAIVP